MRLFVGDRVRVVDNVDTWFSEYVAGQEGTILHDIDGTRLFVKVDGVNHAFLGAPEGWPLYAQEVELL